MALTVAAATLCMTGACGGRRDAPENQEGRQDRTAEAAAAPASDSGQPDPPAPAPDLSDLASVAPTGWGTDLPGIVRSVPTTPGVRTLALTFDACGGPGGSSVDTELLDLLREQQIPATLFLNSRWVDVNTNMAKFLAGTSLFKTENHGTRHCPLSVTGREAYGIVGTRSVDDAAAEITGNRNLLTRVTGTTPGWFRCGTAHYDDVALTVAGRLDVRIAGYTTNMDAGATFTPDQVAAQLQDAPDGAICIGHMNQPGQGTAEGLRRTLSDLDRSTTRFVHLA